MENYELYHHGVKGMKWGVRRQKRADARTSKKFARMIKDIHKEAEKYKYTNPNKKQEKKTNKLIAKTNRYMDKLDKKYGTDWSHGFMVEDGKQYVEATIRGTTTRYQV